MSINYAELRERAEKRKAAHKARVERDRAAMKYRGLINIDFTHQNPNEYQKLLAALIAAGWAYLETSALLIEGDLATVLHALQIVSKQCQDAGVLSALTIHVQGSSNFTGVPYSAAKNHPYALRDVLAKQFPKPSPKKPTT